MTAFKIGALAALTATNAPTIRYYEGIGLMPRPRRSGAQRFYDDGDVKRLTFIRRCREFGFSIEQVRALTKLMVDRDRSCLDARTLAHEHLSAVREKVRELRALERSIASFVESCDTRCAGGPGPDCVILEDLSSPKAKLPSRQTRKTAHAQDRAHLRRRRAG